VDDDDFADEDFADDEFASSDFDGTFGGFDRGDSEASTVGFGEHAFPASELDGWELDSAAEDGNDEEDAREDLFDPWGEKKSKNKYTEEEVEALFDAGDDDDDAENNDDAPFDGWSRNQQPSRRERGRRERGQGGRSRR